MGSGVWVNMLGLNVQSYFWMLNGCILCVCFNVICMWLGYVDLVGVSSYGIGLVFCGKVYLGGNVYVGILFEYSLSCCWVLVLDFIYSCNDFICVCGVDDLLVLLFVVLCLLV